MVRIAFVEDDPAVMETLVDYIRRYERQYGGSFELMQFSDGDEIVSDYRAIYDIIFLDVQMKRMDGMTAAEHIRKVDSDVILVFITNMAQFAIRGYAVDAMDYVLKPVPYFAFSQQLQKALARVKKRGNSFLNLSVDGGLRRVAVSSVYYLESDGHRVNLYTEAGPITAAGSLKDFEEKLAEQNFVRCNSGYLVNLAQVTSVQQSVAQVGPHAVQISRPRKKAFMEALTDYLGGL